MIASKDQRPALEINGLTKVFGRGPTAIRAVDGIDLRVKPGEVLGLLGPNGAGKTTTIKMTGGLVQPTSGRVQIMGEDLARRRGAAVRHIGAVLEGGRNVYWSLSAWQNALYFGRLRGLRRAEIVPRAERLLRELGLWDRRHEQVGGFSRGMQQKVAVVAALVTDPDLVLLDEPTIGLDVHAARTVKEWIRRLAHEEGKAIVLTTHQLGLAQELSDRVAVIREGAIVADLPVGELLDRFRESRYEIRTAVPAPELDGRAGGIRIEPDGDGGSRLVVPTADSETVYAVLGELSARHVPLVSVNPVRPDLEDVFLQLVGENA